MHREISLPQKIGFNRDKLKDEIGTFENMNEFYKNTTTTKQQTKTKIFSIWLHNIIEYIHYII